MSKVKSLILTILFTFCFSVSSFAFFSGANDPVVYNDFASVYAKADKAYPMMSSLIKVTSSDTSSPNKVCHKDFNNFLNTMMDKGYSPFNIIQLSEYEMIIIWNKDRYGLNEKHD